MLIMQIRCRALLFDMDGVLVDSTPAVVRVWTAWANRFGLDPAEVVRQAHGRPSIATIRELLPSADHLAEDLAIQKAEIEDLEDVIALPGTTEFLSALPDDRYAVVTSATRGLAVVRLRVAGFAIPKNLVTSSDVHRGKPDPEPYLRGAQILGLLPADCIVIEDAPAGIQSGKAAGSRVIALRTTTPDFALRAAGADWIVTDCSEIFLQPIEADKDLVLELP
ncbi:MAG TPA: HAD family hydrolase [Candidatus Dormibacteraeota bacterium]|jgi:mannitol-1-/sugar-/sorbitol-6-phosphatase|nr:HAD family hydrolase [Candidatus Dormibacteraeota bacterium]